MLPILHEGFPFFWYGSLAVSSMFRDSYSISVVIQPPSFGFLSSTSCLTSAPLLEYSWNASCNLSISHFTPSVKLTVVPTALVHWWILKKVVSRAQVFSSVSLPIRLRIFINYLMPFLLHTSCSIEPIFSLIVLFLCRPSGGVSMLRYTSKSHQYRDSADRPCESTHKCVHSMEDLECVGCAIPWAFPDG